MKNPLDQVEPADPAVSHPNSLCTPTHTPYWSKEEQKRPWLFVSPAKQKVKHLWVINTLSSTNTKHRPAPATTKDIDITLAKTSTGQLLVLNFINSTLLSNQRWFDDLYCRAEPVEISSKFPFFSPILLLSLAIVCRLFFQHIIHRKVSCSFSYPLFCFFPCKY